MVFDEKREKLYPKLFWLDLNAPKEVLDASKKYQGMFPLMVITETHLGLIMGILSSSWRL